jgi:hypothetical protein
MLALTPGPVQRDGDLVRRMMVLSGGMAAMSGAYPSDSVPHTQAFALYNIKKSAARFSWIMAAGFFIFCSDKNPLSQLHLRILFVLYKQINIHRYFPARKTCHLHDNRLLLSDELSIYKLTAHPIHEGRAAVARILRRCEITLLHRKSR